MMEKKTMRVSCTTLALAAAFALGACGPVNRGLESVNQPIVQRTDYVFDVAGADGLSSAEEKRLVDWFDAVHLRYGDRVSIDSRNGDAGTHDAIAAIVARYGILLSETAPVTQGSDQLSGTRVVVSRSLADVPNCPDWRRPSQPEFAASTMSNFGCATNRNLAAMVADPADLVQGREINGNDPLTISRAIKTYREKDPTGKGDLKNDSPGSSGGSSGGH
jgi:pilus assembly protein CpaD